MKIPLQNRLVFVLIFVLINRKSNCESMTWLCCIGFRVAWDCVNNKLQCTLKSMLRALPRISPLKDLQTVKMHAMTIYNKAWRPLHTTKTWEHCNSFHFLWLTFDKSVTCWTFFLTCHNNSQYLHRFQHMQTLAHVNRSPWNSHSHNKPESKSNK